MKVSGNVYFLKKSVLSELNGGALFGFISGLILTGTFLVSCLYYLYDRAVWFLAVVSGLGAGLFLIAGSMMSVAYPYIYINDLGFTWFETSIWNWLFKKPRGLPRFILWKDVACVQKRDVVLVDWFTGKRKKAIEMRIHLKNVEQLILLSIYFHEKDFNEIFKLFAGKCSIITKTHQEVSDGNT